MALKPGLPSSKVCSPHTAVFAGAPYRLRTTAGVETACSPVLLLRVSRDPRARTSPGAAHTSWGRAQSLCPVCVPCLAGSPAWQRVGGHQSFVWRGSGRSHMALLPFK